MQHIGDNQMFNKALEIYEQEMCRILPYRFDWRGSMLAIGTMALCVIGVVVGMLAMAGVF